MSSGPGGEPGRDRWLLSFADLLTLLFAFMLVLYASTAFNDEQQRELGRSLRTSFGGTPASPTAVEALSERLRPELARLLILEVLKVEEDPHFLRLVINSRMLFPPGAVAINDRYDTLLGFLVTQVEALPLRLTVEGHTDNAPVFSGPFSTNLAPSLLRGQRRLGSGFFPSGSPLRRCRSRALVRSARWQITIARRDGREIAELSCAWSRWERIKRAKCFPLALPPWQAEAFKVAGSQSRWSMIF